MTSGKKTALSLLITVILFSAFAVVAFSGLFEIIETRFYQPAVIAGIEKQLNSIGEAFTEYSDLYLERFRGYAENDDVKASLNSTLTSEQIAARTDLTGNLMLETPALLGIRILDSNQSHIHFSTFNGDILKETEKALSYKNYPQIEEIDCTGLFTDEDSTGMIYYDTDRYRIIYVFPIFDSYKAYRGSILFYTDADDFNRFLLTRRLTTVNNSALFAGDGTHFGYIFGLPNTAVDAFVGTITDSWSQGKLSAAPLISTGDDTWVVISCQTEHLTLSRVENETMFVFSQLVKILLLAAVFLTMFLVILLLFSIKQDDMVIIRDRIKRFQFALVSEYLEKQDDPDWDKVSKEIEARKNDVMIEVKQSLAKRGKRHEAEVDALLEKSWNDIFTALGRPPVQAGAQQPVAVSVDTSEIRKMLEDLVAKTEALGPARIAAPKTKPAAKAAPVKAAPAAKPIFADEAENVEELDEVEEVEELGEVEEIDEVEDVEELGEIEEVEEIDEAEEVEELGEVEEVEEIDEAEEVEELGEAEEVEEIDEVEDVEELGEIEEVEEIDDVQELEEANDSAPSVSAADESLEPADVQELDEVEEVEEIGETEDVEESGETEEVEEIDDVQETEKVVESAETEASENADDSASNAPVLEEPLVAEDVQEDGETGVMETEEEILLPVSEVEPAVEQEPAAGVESEEEPVSADEEEVEAELIPVDEVREFSFIRGLMSHFSRNAVNIDSEPEVDPILEEDGVFRIADNLDTSHIRQDVDFKNLVDSVLTD